MKALGTFIAHKVLFYFTPRHCLLGCGHPGRPQREGLPHWMKVPPVNLSSLHVPMTHRGRMALIDVLDRNVDIDRLQSSRYYMTEKTNMDCHS